MWGLCKHKTHTKCTSYIAPWQFLTTSGLYSIIETCIDYTVTLWFSLQSEHICSTHTFTKVIQDYKHTHAQHWIDSYASIHVSIQYNVFILFCILTALFSLTSLSLSSFNFFCLSAFSSSLIWVSCLIFSSFRSDCIWKSRSECIVLMLSLDTVVDCGVDKKGRREGEREMGRRKWGWWIVIWWGMKLYREKWKMEERNE